MLVHCYRCDARVDALERGEYDDGPDFGVGRFVLFECPSCNGPIVVHQRAFSATSANEPIWSQTVLLFPTGRSISEAIPDPIARSLQEARRCLGAGAYLAAVVMCRKTLEALARDHYGKVKNLARAVDRLHAEGKVDARLHEWAVALRQDGNLAAHDPDHVIPQEDAVDLIDFTEAILEYIYVLNKRFDAYKSRRSAVGHAAADLNSV